MPDLRLALVGPESSGKTTLALAIEVWLQQQSVTTMLIEEQGRALALRLPAGHAWSWREQQATSLMHQAAEAQTALILDCEPGRTAMIADGTAATPLVWHTSAVRRRPHYEAGKPEVTEDLVTAVERAEYDLVLLTAPDLPWVPDGIRDDPDGRDDAFSLYTSLYPDAVVIEGDGRQHQAQSAIAAVLG